MTRLFGDKSPPPRGEGRSGVVRQSVWRVKPALSCRPPRDRGAVCPGNFERVDSLYLRRPRNRVKYPWSRKCMRRNRRIPTIVGRSYGRASRTRQCSHFLGEKTARLGPRPLFSIKDNLAARSKRKGARYESGREIRAKNPVISETIDSGLIEWQESSQCPRRPLDHREPRPGSSHGIDLRTRDPR
jgi:hypothetical protein